MLFFSYKIKESLLVISLVEDKGEKRPEERAKEST